MGTLCGYCVKILFQFYIGSMYSILGFNKGIHLLFSLTL